MIEPKGEPDHEEQGTDTAAAAGFRAMFEREFGAVCRTLRRLGVRPSEIEDAAQDTFVAVHGKWRTYDPDLPIRPWLFGFAYRIASNYRRRHSTELDEVDPETLADSPSPEEAALGSQAKTIALFALSKMTPDRRDVLVMHDLEGFNAPDIAELLSIPMNTVYSRLRSARADFEAVLVRFRKGNGG